MKNGKIASLGVFGVVLSCTVPTFRRGFSEVIDSSLTPTSSTPILLQVENDILAVPKDLIRNYTDVSIHNKYEDYRQKRITLNIFAIETGTIHRRYFNSHIHKDHPLIIIGYT